MNKRLLIFASAAAMSLAAVNATLAQNDQTTRRTTTVTRQTTETVRNADGTYNVIEYPADKEVTLEFPASTMLPGVNGTARVMRSSNETTVNFDVTGLTGDATSYNLYAVDQSDKVTLLGPVTVNNGTGTATFKTSLNQFMLVLSPEANLTSMGTDTKVVLRSGVPQGMAVVPVAHSGSKDGAPVGERVTATTTPGGTSAYNAPLLGIPNLRRGTDTHMRVRFSGDLTGARANIFLLPRNDGPTQIKMRFHNLKRAPAGKRIALYAVAPDNTFTKLGQVINTGLRNEAQIQTETALGDFGLLVTLEDAKSTSTSPTGGVVGTVVGGM